MSFTLETVSSIGSYLRVPGRSLPAVDALNCFQLEADYASLRSSGSVDLQFLHGLVARILHRGVGTLPSLAVERQIVSLFGSRLDIQENTSEDAGSVKWQVGGNLWTGAIQFVDYLADWHGEIGKIPVDPDQPKNERRLLQLLFDRYGRRLVPCLYTQVHLSDLLPEQVGRGFLGQRVDFLLSFPNGRCLVLEPGDHAVGATPLAQLNLDRKRDKALSDIGVRTLRFENSRIDTPELLDEIDKQIEWCDGHKYLKSGDSSIPPAQLAMLYQLVLPSLISRIEHVLNTALLFKGLLSQRDISICIVEKDLEGAEIALYSFLDRLQRLTALYGIHLQLPKINLVIVRDGLHSCGELSSVHNQLAEWNAWVEVVGAPPTTSFDLSIDVAMMSNNLTPAENILSTANCIIRNSFPHSKQYRFAYSEKPRAISIKEVDATLLESFLGDFFRKKKLRPGQFPIIRNILAQKTTIGLLPTSAGKSICFQLASILTPGITLVVDPIVFLMKDQVLALSENYGITAIAAWYSDSVTINRDQVGDLMATNLMIFLSPERFLRTSFRMAMRNLSMGDLFINYAVIDEAHCVSMWGHDFRPSYLMLERCLREYCSLGGRQPIIIALTGTASQLVLIDLKRQLNIEDMESIIRPNSFDRDELIYRVVPSTSAEKNQAIQSALHSIERRLGIQDVKREAWGVVFTNSPRQVWEIYQAQGGNADEHILKIANSEEIVEDLPCAMACGGMPDATPIRQQDWNNYKNKILPHFKRGRVRMLIGNAAIGVGIDNEFVNYVVVSCMPASLESLGQQWGRAGRRGQISHCCLIYSDDQTGTTDDWLSGRAVMMPQRWDDLGTISYFHASSFPGEQEDTAGTIQVLGQIYTSRRDNDGRRAVDENREKRVQRYLSFLIMTGIVEDYEATGFEHNTKYRVALAPELEEQFLAPEPINLQAHLVRSLQAYLSRYRPTSEKEVRDGLVVRPEERWSRKAVGFLVHFIYSSIAYQRKESVRTIVGFCREQDLSLESIRRRMKAFFDRNPKFSDRLEAMAQTEPSFKAVMEIVSLIEGFDDSEHLFWETRRLLDERFRADWAAVNLFSVLYREKVLSEKSKVAFKQILDEIDSSLAAVQKVGFLVGFLHGIISLDKLLIMPISAALLPELFTVLYSREGTSCIQVLDSITCDQETKARIRGLIAVNQMEGVLNVIKHKHGLG